MNEKLWGWFQIMNENNNEMEEYVVEPMESGLINEVNFTVF